MGSRNQRFKNKRSTDKNGAFSIKEVCRYHQSGRDASPAAAVQKRTSAGRCTSGGSEERPTFQAASTAEKAVLATRKIAIPAGQDRAKRGVNNAA